MFSLLIMLCGFVVADSVSSFGTDVSLSVTQSIDLSYSYEYPLSEDSNTSFLVGGGPTLQSDSYWEDTHPGLKLETELRGYKENGLAGFFVSGFVGTSVLWPDLEETRESVSLNFKLGWKQNLRISGFPVSIEPNCSAGIMLDNDNDEGWELILKPVMNFDLKFALFHGSKSIHYRSENRLYGAPCLSCQSTTVCPWELGKSGNQKLAAGSAFDNKWFP